MGILSKIGFGGLGKAFDAIGGIVDDLHLSGEEKSAFKLQLETLLQQRDSEIEETLRQEIVAHKEIVLAELQSGNLAVKMARPSIIYMGLFVIFFNYVLPALITMLEWGVAPTIEIPIDFWIIWGGVVSVYSVGRSAERRGMSKGWGQKAASAINGTPKTALRGTLFDPGD